MEAVAFGAVTKGTNKATLLLLNLCLIGCALVCTTLIFLPLGLPDHLLPHIIGLLLLTLALQLSINWLVIQTGTVTVEEQRRELFGEAEAEGSPAGSIPLQLRHPGEQAAEQPTVEQVLEEEAASAASLAAAAGEGGQGGKNKEQ